MNISNMLSAESLKALEQLGRSPVRKPQRQPPKAVVHNSRTVVTVPQQKLPFILSVIRDVGCDTIYVEDTAQGMVAQGLVIAHWTKEELSAIAVAVEANEFTYRKTWRNTWATVITC